MWHVGLDAHRKQSTFCVLDENGQKIRSRTIRGGWQKLLNELESIEKPFAVCFNDRVDAEKLTKRLFLGEVPPVYVPSVQVRSWRSMIEHRRRLVQQRAGTKNTLRALLRSHGIRPAVRPWAQRGMAWLRQVELPTEMDQLQRDLLVERLESLINMIKRVGRRKPREDRYSPPGRAFIDDHSGGRHPDC